MKRRDMLKTTAALGLFLPGISGLARGEDSPNERLNVALVGLGNQGGYQVNGLKSQNYVALCDCDERMGGKVFEAYPDAKKYFDYRKMFDEMANQIDAVAVSTPDHSHFHPAFTALSLNKHLYLEKPMAHSVSECRILTELAREKKRATQLGMQRHANPGMRRIVEAVKSGVIGDVTDVYVWINSSRGMPEPLPFEPAPEGVHWDVWVGPAPFREFSSGLCPYKWRFWWDYGTGETGNWCCHNMDMAFWALDLTYPEFVSATGPERDAERTPQALESVLKFPAHGNRKAVTMHWGQGMPEYAKNFARESGLKLGNTLFVGTRGTLSCDYSRFDLWPSDTFSQWQAPEPTIPNSPGFHREWIDACKGGTPASCNFDYSGKIAEAGLLANAAYRIGAKEGIRWNAETLRSPDTTEIDAYTYPTYRKGWEI
ncbi:MAG: Gfo/Idh/MocA family oxidoreductase [Planctomycetia bacterium]|nr:Gfo/Idh/MocA family oxidoreductase [Planctomycetia bacterium]